MIESKELDRIDRRVVEALAVAPVIRAVSEKIGRENALCLLIKVNEQEAFERGKRLAAQLGKNGIDELVGEVSGWGRGGGWAMDVLEKTARTYFFNVTRCPYYEKYKELGLEEFGVGFSCCRDAPFARGFNPRLRLVRTRTIMEGADHCDFRYHLYDE